MKKLLFLAFVLLIAMFVASEMIFSFLITPQSIAVSEPQIFEVPRGASLSQVAARLESGGFIRNARIFKIYAILRASDRSLKMGQYHLRQGQTPNEILGTLSSGKSIQYTVTFPEGSNIFEVAKRLEQTGQYSYAEVLAALQDGKFVESLLGTPLPSLEGYLFPETYKYTKYTTHRELIRSMVNRFLENYQIIQSLHPTSLSRHEMVTLASVIEKETGAPEERPLIASVFHNRLKRGMRLQSDPTIIYGMWVSSGKEPFNITKSDILKPSPYNTYTVAKLPVGPISNPGKEALVATFNPAQSEFLFFVSKNDGTHIFSRTYEEHAKAVRQFQMNSQAREGKSWRDLSKKKKTESLSQ